MEQVGLGNIDVVIAAYEDDGRNVIAALQSRQLGLEKVIAIVQEPEYIGLLEQNKVVAISAPWATAAMVENLLDRPGLAQQVYWTSLFPRTPVSPIMKSATSKYPRSV